MRRFVFYIVLIFIFYLTILAVGFSLIYHKLNKAECRNLDYKTEVRIFKHYGFDLVRSKTQIDFWYNGQKTDENTVLLVLNGLEDTFQILPNISEEKNEFAIFIIVLSKCKEVNKAKRFSNKTEFEVDKLLHAIKWLQENDCEKLNIYAKNRAVEITIKSLKKYNQSVNHLVFENPILNLETFLNRLVSYNEFFKYIYNRSVLKVFTYLLQTTLSIQKYSLTDIKIKADKIDLLFKNNESVFLNAIKSDNLNFETNEIDLKFLNDDQFQLRSLFEAKVNSDEKNL